MKPTRLKCPKCYRKFDAEYRPIATVVRKCRTPDPEPKTQLTETDRGHLQRLVGLGAGHALLHAAIAATPRLFRNSEQFKCPWCHAQLTVMAMVIMANAVEPNSVQKTRHSKLQEQTVAKAGVNIALNAFGEAVREQARLIGASDGTVIGVPKDMIRHFEKFLRSAAVKEIRHSLISRMEQVEPDANFQVWQTEGVALV